MEVFEVHITGDSSIIEQANKIGVKSIEINLLKPDKSYLRTEYMTSQVYRFEDFSQCKKHVEEVVEKLKAANVLVHRVKIESPYYEHYVKQSLYMESHFEAKSDCFAMSKNVRKDTFLATDREYDQSYYNAFKEIYEGEELELCLYDDNIAEDADWFELYENNSCKLQNS